MKPVRSGAERIYLDIYTLDGDARDNRTNRKVTLYVNLINNLSIMLSPLFINPLLFNQKSTPPCLLSSKYLTTAFPLLTNSIWREYKLT
jgi:hypothetical protein